MLDLSNNNGSGHDFRRAVAAGQHRLYLKRTESTGFVDALFPALSRDALAASMKVGAYHFAHGHGTPGAEAAYFIQNARAHYKRPAAQLLRPCLDLESSAGSAPASPELGRWAAEWIAIVSRALGYPCAVYGSPYFLEACRFSKPPGTLWLASYGRDNGREYPFKLPRPWASAAAHQYTSNGLVPGIRGRCDVSRLIRRTSLDLGK